MSSAIYILDKHLNLLIQRQYRQDLDVRYILQSFKSIHSKSKPISCPVLENNDIIFTFLEKDEIILMSPIFNDIDIISHITFLNKFSELLIKYFLHYKLIKTPILKSDLIKDNYTLIYELFDECNDFGIPQLTDFNILKDYIKLMVKQDDHDNTDSDVSYIESEINSSISRTSMNRISWRPKGIFYNKNEFFINFNEFLKFKYNYKINKIIINQIEGKINCKCYLSGMPILKLGLNENFENRNNNNDYTKSIFNNIQYHQCVDLSLIDEDSIEFIPPDNEFNLLNYQILNTSVLKPLILVKPKFRIFKKNDIFKLRIKIDLVTTFKRKFIMTDVKINIPLIIKKMTLLFINFDKPLKFKTKLGIVLHNLDKNTLIWKIEKLQGSMSGEMLAEFDLINENELYSNHYENLDYGKQDKNDLFYFELNSEIAKIEHVNPLKDIDNLITCEFQLQNMLYSGLKVNYLTIKEDQLKFQSFPWIMYCIYSKGDDYSFILSDDQFVNELEPEVVEYINENGKWTGKLKENDETINPDPNRQNDFSTALDHADPIINQNDLNFEEYMEDEEELNDANEALDK